MKGRAARPETSDVSTVDESSASAPRAGGVRLLRSPEGAYEVQGEVARGGLGVVLRVRDTRLGRVVAVKLLLDARPGMRERFVREALVTARLEHPGIVPVYEAGLWPDGEPFYAMKLIAGQPLSALLRDAGTLEQRLALLPNVVAVAETLAYAHSRGVIHRDVKPSNVVVGEFGETMIVDWGIAKVLGVAEVGGGDGADPLAADAALTQSGAVVGTPKYMSPEQALGLEVDVRSDVYSLGALLYSVLAGRSPYEGSSDTVLRSVASGPPVAVETMGSQVPPELAAIVARAMARAPDERYPSARQFAVELRRFQTGQLVTAHRYTPWALLIRWARQHRRQLVLASIASAVLVLGAAVSIQRIVRERAEARRAQAVAEARRDDLLLLQARGSLERDPTASLAWVEQYPVDGPRWDDAREILVDAVSRGLASHVWRPGDGGLLAVAISPDGASLAVGGTGKAIHVRDLTRGVDRVLRGSGGPINALRYSPDGRWLASASDDRTVSLWDLQKEPDAARRILGTHDDVATVVDFSPDGARLASAGADRTVRVWDVATGASRVLAGHTLAVWGVAFSPDGRWIASGSRDRTVRLWPSGGGEPRVVATGEPVGQLAFSPDGARLAVAGESTTFLIDVPTGAVRPLAKASTYVVGVAFSPDGRSVATVGGDAVLRVWDVATSRARSFHGHEGSLEKVAFAPDGAAVASVGVDGSARVWPLDAPPGVGLASVPAGLWTPTISPDGQHLAAGGDDGVVRVWDADGSHLRELRGHTGRAKLVAFAPDGTFLASTGADRTTRTWTPATGEGRTLRTGSAESVRLAISPDSKWVAVSDAYDAITALPVVDGPSPCIFRGPDMGPVAFDPRGERIAFEMGTDVRVGTLHDCASTPLMHHEARVFDVAFSPDGTKLASSGLDRGIGLWSFATDHGQMLSGHEMEVLALAFSPDGKTLASTSFDKTVRLWSTDTGSLLSTLRGHTEGTRFVTFARDGTQVISASFDNTVRIWDTRTHLSRLLRGHEARITGLVRSADDHWLYTADTSGALWRWDLERPDEMPTTGPALHDWIARHTTARLGSDDVLSSSPSAAAAGP